MNVLSSWRMKAILVHHRTKNDENLEHIEIYHIVIDMMIRYSFKDIDNVIIFDIATNFKF